MIGSSLDLLVVKGVALVFAVAAVFGLCIWVPLALLMTVFHVPGWLIFDSVEGILRFVFR